MAQEHYGAPALKGTLVGPVCPEDMLEGHYRVQKKETRWIPKVLRTGLQHEFCGKDNYNINTHQDLCISGTPH